MIINRHNYEELFLLYVDNELTAEDRAAVEKWVQQNADVADELEMLKQAMLPYEKIEFEQKELLYNQAEAIGLNNYEKYFLLSVDGELSSKENEEVEKFVLKNPDLQDEYTLLQQTRVEPEAITFAGKEKLYRKEEKERRVVFATWMRVSIAAAITGFAAFSWFFTQNNINPPGKRLAASSPKQVKTPELAKTPDEEIKQHVTKETIAALHEKIPVKVAAETKVKVAKTHQLKTGKDAVAISKIKIKNNPVEAGAAINKTAKSVEIAFDKNQSSDNAIALSKTTNKNNLPAISNDRIDASFTNKKADDPGAPLATHAVYREIDNRQDDEERTFYIGSAEINKNKLKGLFKKAASLFEKKNNKNDGERTLKIAGFEIKSK